MSNSSLLSTSRQRTNRRVNTTIDSRDFYGDKISKSKSKKDIRVIFQNINGLGTSEETDKRAQIRQFINTYKIDVFALAEVNTNWKLVAKKQSLRSQAKEWFEHSRVETSHNLLVNTKSPHQQGGVAIMVSGDMALKVSKTTQDPRHMGRWCSVRMRGKQGVHLRIVSVYVPIVTKSHGNKTVFSQQQAALLKQKHVKSVISTFWKDLWSEIDEWISQGDSIIMTGDWNQDVQSQALVRAFEARNMSPVITGGRHPGSPPETYNNGTYPIDECFATSSLKIKKCGFLRHGDNGSDHRPIWLDVEKASALGSLSPDIHSFRARKLKTTDPRVVQKYNHILEEEFDKHRIYDRALQLYTKLGTSFTAEDYAEYDELDRLRDKSMKKAEKKCRKLHCGGIPWSPQLQFARTTIHYIRLVIRRRKGRKVSARTLIRLQKKLGFSYERVSMDRLLRFLDKAFKEYKKLRKEASSLRDTHLESLAIALEKDGKGKKSQIIKDIKQREEQRGMFRKLRSLNAKYTENMSTTSVVVTNPDGTVSELTNKDEMVQAIIKENISKYHQCEDTCPFLTNPLRDSFGAFGETEATEQVLAGTFQAPSTTNDMTQLFLDQCKSSNTPIFMKRSVAQYEESWRHMKEKTSSHDVHFGHFKASCSHRRNLLVHYVMAEVPFRTGFAPSRWKKATNVMILKKAGLFNIDKLRTLCLFQSDHNHNNKFLGREMMSHAMEHQHIAKEQYSVPGKRSILHALNKTLYFDNIRYGKFSACLTSCDLKSCYDRICHTPAMLAARSYGVPREPLISFFATLQDVQYHTRTVYGVSTETFGGSHPSYTNKPQGSGQGNGAAPQLWAIVSSKMIEMLHTLGLASTIILPLSGTEMSIVGFAYVDDSDLIAYSKSHDIHQTVQQMQRVVNAWERAAKVTGGAIAPLKCWWYLVFFEWDDKNNWFYGHNSMHSLSARDAANNLHELQHLLPHQAQEMLGVHIAPDGNNNDQVKTLLTKAKGYSERMRTNFSYSHEAWVGMTHVAMKSLDYCLPATTMTQQECDKIMWEIIKGFLPKSGINRYIKRDVLFAPPALQGLGMKNLYVMQGIHHVADLVENVWKNSITGHFQLTSLEFLRLELGVNYHLLNSNYESLAGLIMTPSWIVHTWKFMSEYNINIDIDAPKIDTLRENDKPLMELILQNNLVTEQEAVVANKCRLYLQVFMVSDLVTGCGKYLKDNVWNGIRDNHNKSSTTIWPLIPRPSNDMIKTWQSVLRRTLCTVRYKSLDVPLKSWLQIPRYWTWFLDGDELVSRDYKDVVRRHAVVGGTPRRKRYNIKGKRTNECISPTAIPTTIKHHDLYYEVEGTNQVQINSVATSTQQDKYKDWLYVTNEDSDDMTELCNSILQGTAHAVSDGSYFEHTETGAAAWVLTDSSYSIGSEGTSIVPGIGDIHSSFRSEMTGILAILQKLHDICNSNMLDTGHITLHCDNKTALKVISKWQLSKLNPRRRNADLISACIKLRDSLPLKITCHHVYAHQDDTVRFQDLSPIAQLNVLVDKRAKSLAELVNKGFYHQFESSNHPAAFSLCYHDNIPILHCISDTLYEKIYTHKMTKYWMEKQRLTHISKDLINLDAMKKSHSAMSYTQKRFSAKWACEYVPTGKNLQRWKLRYKGNCPYCMCEKEDTRHILTCTHLDAETNWDEASQQWLKRMAKIDTCTYLLGAIRKELHAWRHNLPLPNVDSLPTLLQRAIQEQRAIGWKQFLEGLIGKTWSQYMDRFYRMRQSKRKSTTWAARLISYNWKFVFQIWEFRNKQLHHTERIRELEGMTTVIDAIKAEWNIGIGHLPASQFSHHFKLPLEQLLKKDHEYLKTWLMIIRQGRILLDPRNLCHDEIGESDTLQQWLDISYIITDDEAAPVLKETIAAEWQLGKGGLPSSFNKFFLGSVKTLLNKEVKVLKGWLKAIRQGRVRFDNDNLLLDEFSSPGALRSWLEQ